MREKDREDNALDELKKRLYTRGDTGRRGLRKGHLSSHHEDIGGDWEKDEGIYEEAPKPEDFGASTFRKFFVASAIFFFLAVSYAAYQFLVGGNIVSSKNINMTVLGPSFVSGGDEISLQVSIENRNKVPLEFAEIMMEYPKGATSQSASSTPEMVRKQIPLEKIAAGGTHQEITKAVLYGEEGSQQNIKFTLEYRVQGSNAIFQKESNYPVKISSAPLSLTLDSPRETNSGQDLVLSVNVASNAPKDVPGILLEVDYPPGFLFKDADPKPSYGNNVWRLGDFHAGSARAVKISGTLSGENGEERTFRVSSGSASVDDEKNIGVIYNSIFQTVAIKRAFLDARLSFNGNSGSGVVVPSGREVMGDVVWKNNLPTRITNASISLKLSGNAMDRLSVTSEGGFYNSSENTIIWDRNNDSDFQVIEPGSTGRLTFRFTPMPLFSISGGLLSKPEINIQVVVSGEVNASDGTGGIVSVTTSRSVRVLTDLQLFTRAAYFSGPFHNTGPLPPVADSETTYTVIWSVVNSANDVTGASVTTTLPQYVSWTNEVSPANEDVSYDDSKRAVVWRLGTVSAGTGYGNLAREVAFQVKLVPSLSHIGSSVGLTGDAVLSGVDSFAKAPVQSSKSGVYTLLTNEPGFKAGNEIVVSPK